MKAYIIVVLLFLSSFTLMAQEEEDIVIRGTKEITKELAPQQVVDSLNKRFPDAEAVKYFKVPPGGVVNGWNVTEEENSEVDENMDYYTISFKRSNLQYYGLYKSDGTLLKSKMEETDVNLPDPVKSSLMGLKSLYPGFKIVAKTHYKSTNYSKSKEYYEVVAKKENETKTLYYAPDGQLVKVKEK